MTEEPQWTAFQPYSQLVRGYVSGEFLWAANHFALRARELENNPATSTLDREHRSCVVASVLNACGFLEASVNEWFENVDDDYTTGGLAALAPFELPMKTYWAVSRGRDSILNKYRMLLGLTGRNMMPTGEQPWQGASDLVDLRNELIHSRPISNEPEPHDLAKRLRGKFDANKLMAADTGHPWWPYHCLGAGCAKWSYERALAFAERVADELGIDPTYRLLLGTYGSKS